MHVLRTPDSRFDSLPDFAFTPRFLDIDDGGTRLGISSIDEGSRTARPVLLMHGEPSWSFLYRHIITRLAAKGHRVVAPDLIGFGRSDKPTEPTDYTYENHVRWMSHWLNTMKLDRITLFCQDWGGLIGLRLVANFADRFDRVIVANTGLPIGEGWSEGFQRWLDFSQKVPTMPIGNIVDGGTVRSLTQAEIDAYDAPFPDESYKVGARRFPLLVPITPQHASVAENIAAWKALEALDKPFLTAFSDSDPVTGGGDRKFQERIPGAKGQPHTTIVGGGHFLQEDKPDEIADLIDAFISRTS